MNDKLHPENQHTAEFTFLGNPRRVIDRERDNLELENYSVIWERTFDERGRPLEWKFFEDSALSSISEYRYEGEECVVTERDAQGKVIETIKQKPFSVTVRNCERISWPDSAPVAGTGLVASFKHEFEFDSKGNWIKHTTTTTLSSDKAAYIHVEEREITYW
ncbi:MAG: hypothetical protein GZ088_11460 [Acidipila sp.]|nr:hypothetical protein [Acidipila sp.]